MSKLYIFAIGGTGSRVLRSFAMMLASGVKLGCDEIVPMIIDPDASNADLTRTVLLLDKYTEIHNKLKSPQNSENNFFKTTIDKYTNDYTLPIDNVNSMKFEDFIDIANLGKEDEAMVRMLFSNRNLKSNMDVGFKGNPNIGSVVLNEVVDSPVFQKFDTTFTPNDKIFIISSIFGGTGASGFPMLVKTLRESKVFKNSQTINDAYIGAITVLPYFTVGVDSEGLNEINSATFASKTKSALEYYEDNIAKNNIVDELYFIGDTQTKLYDYSVGGDTQKNKAHLVEFMAATALVDFSSKSLDSNKPRQTTCYELGVEAPKQASISFKQFGRELNGMVRKPLTQFILMANTLLNKGDFLKNQLAATQNVKDIYDSEFFENLKEFIRTYKEWLYDMEDNNRSLKLFNLDCGDKPFDVVNGYSPETGFFEKLKGADYKRLFRDLNKAGQEADKIVKGSNETYFLEMFSRATSNLIAEKFKF